MDEGLFQQMQHVARTMSHWPVWKWVGAILLACFGGMRPAITAIFILYCADWFFGLWYALATRTLSSARSMRGVAKAFLYGGVILVGAQLSKAQVAGLALGVVIGGVFDWGVAITEGISVLENIDNLLMHYGLEFSLVRMLARRLKQVRDREIEQLGAETVATKEG